MLKKMLIQGLGAAAVIAIAAAVYARAQAQTQAETRAQTGAQIQTEAPASDNGYLAAPAPDGRVGRDRDGHRDANREDSRLGESGERGTRDQARLERPGRDHDGDDD